MHGLEAGGIVALVSREGVGDLLGALGTAERSKQETDKLLLQARAAEARAAAGLERARADLDAARATIERHRKLEADFGKPRAAIGEIRVRAILEGKEPAAP